MCLECNSLIASGCCRRIPDGTGASGSPAITHSSHPSTDGRIAPCARSARARALPVVRSEADDKINHRP